MLYICGYRIECVTSDLELGSFSESFKDARLKTVNCISGEVNTKTHLEARDDIFVLEGTPCPVVLRSRGERPASYTDVGPLLLRGKICAYSISHGVEDYLRD